MENFDLVEYIIEKGKSSSDVLWNQGRVFTLHDENQNPIEIEEFGSYVDHHQNIKVSDNNNGVYDDYDTNIDEYGSRPRLFFRVQSDFFKSLIEEKKNNPNCSYVSCVDNLLNEGYVPEKISANVQQLCISRATAEKSEALASKLLNFFEAPTIFCDNLKFHKPEQGNQTFVVSPDFLKPNEIMMNLNQYMKPYVFNNDNKAVTFETIEGLVNIYKQIFDAHYKNVLKAGFEIPDEKTLSEKFESWKDQICYMTLVRKYAMGDSDFKTRNLGVVINTKTNDINIAPAFDLELHGKHAYVFGGSFMRYVSENAYEFKSIKNWVLNPYRIGTTSARNFIDDLDYIQKNCPQAIEKFLSKADELLDNGGLDDYFDEVTRGNLYLNTYKKDYKTGLTFVRDFCNDFVNESLAEFDM